MRRRLVRLGCAAALFIAAMPLPAEAQQPTPDSSVAMVGTTLISVHYAAPLVGGREIFGNVVPYNRVWRTGGEGEATTFRTLRPIRMGDVNVPKGTYTIFTIPAPAERPCNGAAPQSQAVLILSRQSGGDFDEAQQVARVPMRACRLENPVERLAIRVLPGGGRTGTLRIEWERTRYDVPFSLAR
jgi:hypothetical protein